MSADERAGDYLDASRAEEVAQFQVLLGEARAGRPAAWDAVIALYHDPMVRVVRRELHRRPVLRRVVDAEDVAQEVWLHVARILRQGRDFADGTRFLHYLAVAARNGVRKKLCRYATCKRSLHRERPLAAQAACMPSHERDPAECAAADDYLRLRVNRLSMDSDERWVMVWYVCGYSPVLVGERLHMPVHTVRRVIARVLARWRDLDG